MFLENLIDETGHPEAHRLLSRLDGIVEGREVALARLQSLDESSDTHDVEEEFTKMINFIEVEIKKLVEKIKSETIDNFKYNWAVLNDDDSSLNLPEEQSDNKNV